MSIKDYCSKEVVTVGPMEPIDAAAKLMLDHNVGCLVVVDENKPIGIITDRDILRGVVAPHRTGEITYVDEVMTSQLITVSQTAGVFEVIYTLREEGVRRLPVVAEQGYLVGLIALDDLLVLMATELADLAGISIRERHREREKMEKAG